MGMPITIEIVDKRLDSAECLTEAFDFFTYTDKTFSTYKKDSEISKINFGLLKVKNASPDVQSVLKQCDNFTLQTHGYFEIARDGSSIDPSGLVKGWSISKVGEILESLGCKNFYIDAGGDVLVKGFNARGSLWRIGVRHPFQTDKIAKVLRVTDLAVATSANYERGNHIYNPKTGQPATYLASVTVVGTDMITADVFATAIFAAEENYSDVIAALPNNYQAYIITSKQQVTYTPALEAIAIS
jgi:thiamine biosynthesis lipoprotein